MQTGRAEVAWNCVDRLCKMYDRVFKGWRTAVNAYPLEVFIVTEGDYEDYMIVSVHPTLREAMDAVPEVGSWTKHGDRWAPAPLLERLAAAGKTFASHSEPVTG